MLSGHISKHYGTRVGIEKKKRESVKLCSMISVAKIVHGRLEVVTTNMSKR